MDILLNLSGGGPKRFTYAELKVAINNFSNEVGKGGFRMVYSGLLPNQRQIVVKKLKGVSQGEAQLWGFCTDCLCTSIYQMGH